MRPAVLGRDDVPSQAIDDYNRLIRRLRDLRPPLLGLVHPAADIILQFDDGALKVRENLEREHLELSQCSSLNRKLASHIGKYNGIFARLCVIWHCVEHAFDAQLPRVVTENTAQRVANFLRGFLLPHAIAFYAGMARSPLPPMSSFFPSRRAVPYATTGGCQGSRCSQPRRLQGLA